MTVGKLYECLDSAIPSELSCDWDNDGLMCCPSPDKRVSRVLIALDVTDDAADYAAEYGFDTIITHHPLIFKPIKNLTSPKLINLVVNDIAVMSFHTRLDALDGGVNDTLAELLGVENAVPFGAEGIGRVGELRECVPAAEFAKFVKERLGCGFVKMIGSGVCSRVAVLGGDGKSELSEALEAGADTYVTGQMSHNTMTDASELPVTVIEAGHFETENPVCRVLEKYVNTFAPDAYTEIFSGNVIKTV